MIIDRDSEILFNREVAFNTYLMGLNAPAIVEDAKPGQFVMIRVDEGMDPLLRRPFSICGTRGSEVLLILYRVVGRGTRILSEIPSGKRIAVLGPLGKGFQLPQGGGFVLMAAGGIGIAPLVFLWQQLEACDGIFMAGYRTGREVIPMDRLDIPILDARMATDDGTVGHRGPVTDLLEYQLAHVAGGEVALYACGPVSMLKRVAIIARDRNLPCQVSLEANMGCGLGACLGCALKGADGEKPHYVYVCRDGPVFSTRSIDWECL
jgi:dihydroorotate dehydrogenase electron transfer subunit